MLDATVVGIALPRIGKDFGIGVADLQWVVTAYTLSLSAFLLLGGTLGDRFGRRRVFGFGLLWFAVASAVCAAAPTADILIAARGLQGVGGALLTPGSLAILQASFRPDDRARAIGAWSGLGGLASAAGPLVGGYLLAVASWRWVFVINMPLAAVVLWIARRYVPESFDENAGSAGRIDVSGAVWAIVALSTLIYPIIEGPSVGWSSPAIVVSLAVGVSAVAAFVVTERRVRNPMLPPGLFSERQFAATNATTFVVYAALSGNLFLTPVALQQVAGYSPLESGVATLPITVLMLLLSARSGRLASRIGPRLQMAVGPLIVGAGLLLLTRLTIDHNYITGVLPGTIVLGLGLVTTVAPLTSTAMSSAPPSHVGIASAVNNDVARVGGLIAVAALPPLAALTGDAYLHASTFAHGFRIASVICAVACALGGAVAAIFISNGRHKLDPTTGPTTGPARAEEQPQRR
ncbi:MAG: MFS transporter [Actinobacteria bacterium]|nr:MFS transporter [Actinomycetota bacterium]